MEILMVVSERSIRIYQIYNWKKKNSIDMNRVFNKKNLTMENEIVIFWKNVDNRDTAPLLS